MVHPRACGERAEELKGQLGDRGSSPRLRGTRKTHRRACPGLRFIPAPAGNALPIDSVADLLSVHPRACGERSAGRSTPGGYSGSSPRLRGTLMGNLVNTSPDRFIPAPAGNASPMPGAISVTAVHPRACGERGWIQSSTASSAGSSPRLRGTPEGHDVSPFAERFIPAPAGNARAAPMRHHCRPVHPRACGERISFLQKRQSPHGSSPRLRGTPGTCPSILARSRFIPAPAGNAPWH